MHRKQRIVFAAVLMLIVTGVAIRPSQTARLATAGSKIVCNYEHQPLGFVLSDLARQAGMTLDLNVIDWEDRTRSPQTPITVKLNKPISLKGALNLILSPFELLATTNLEEKPLPEIRIMRGPAYGETYDLSELNLQEQLFARKFFDRVELFDCHVEFDPQTAIAKVKAPQAIHEEIHDLLLQICIIHDRTQKPVLCENMFPR